VDEALEHGGFALEELDDLPISCVGNLEQLDELDRVVADASRLERACGATASDRLEQVPGVAQTLNHFRH
jgi:hypothetical protein